MLVDIDKIVVGDRIRKDFGDIQELADDIRENGLINPPVVNKEYVLLAGERRLKACKLLGWPQIEVRMMDTRDAEHELNIEISENDERKGFTKSERVDYMRRLLRIEQAKAKERQLAGTSAANATEVGRSDEATAKQFGTSAKTMRREMFIADNADMLDPADFAEWDEGRLSTNKAYQRIKATLTQAEHDRKVAELERDNATEALAESYRASEAAESEIQSLRRQLDERPTEVREVEPPDYEATKRRVGELKHERDLYLEDLQRAKKKNEAMSKELKQAQELLGEDDRRSNARRDIAQLTAAINTFLRVNGGNLWAFDQFYRVDDVTQQEFKKAISNMAAFSQNVLLQISETEQKGTQS